MQFEEYILKLEEFVSKDYSYDDRLLLDIEIWSSMQSKKYLDKIESKGLTSEMAIEYLSLGFRGNYSILLEDNSPLSYQDIIDDFKRKKMYSHSWKEVNEYKHQIFVSKGLACDSLAMYMQIEHINLEEKRSLDPEEYPEIRGLVKFIFPGVLDSLHNTFFKKGTIFHAKRDLANSIINVSKYIAENQIPARIDLCANYQYMTDTKQSMIYNPLGKELKIITAYELV